MKINPKKLKFPPARTCTIAAMLEYAANSNGVSRQTAIRSAVAYALANIAQLNRVPDMLWKDRKRAVRALENIDRIGIMEKLELQAPQKSLNGSINEMSKVARHLGLYVYKLDGRVIITRMELAIKQPELRSLAEMPVSERGASSPEFGMEIDTGARLASAVWSSRNAQDQATASTKSTL